MSSQIDLSQIAQSGATTNQVLIWNGSSWTSGVTSAISLINPRTISTTGDISWTTTFDGSQNVTGLATLASVNGNTGTFGSAAAVPILTVNAKGLITSVSTASLGTAAVKNTGTSGNTVPLLDGANLWSGDQTFGNATITGNLNITGTTTTVNSTNLSISDAIINLANNNSNAAAANIGIRVIRSTGADDSYMVWNEAVGGFIFYGTATNESFSSATKANIYGKRFLADIAFTSVVPTGTAPLVVSSTTQVSNLNVELLGGNNSAYYLNAGNLTGTLSSARLPAFTGDVTSTVGTSALTLATVNSTPGSFGSAAAVPILAVNAKGLVTSVSTAALGTAAVKNTGTTGNVIPLLDGANTWSAGQSFNGAVTLNEGAQLKVYSNPYFYANAFFSAGLNLTASTASGPSLNIPHGAAPSSPTNGDMWTTTAGLFTQINGATRAVAYLDSSITGNAASASRLINVRTISATGDLAYSVSFDGTANVTSTATLATVNSNVGSFGGNATNPVVPTFTVNGKGLVTASGSYILGSASTKNTGTSGNVVPLLDGTNTWTNTQTLGSGAMLSWTASGTSIGSPAYSTRSVGTKVILYPALNTSSADYALGIDAATLWFGTPGGGESFKWYHGTALTASLSQTGALTLAGGLTATTGSFAGGILQTGSAGTRFENTGNGPPANASGIGLELLGRFSSTSYIQSYDRTNSVYGNLHIDALNIYLAPNGVTTATISPSLFSTTTAMSVGGGLTVTGTASFLTNATFFGPTAATPGSGANLRLRDDTGAGRWLIGILGNSGATNFNVYDIVGGVTRFSIDSGGNASFSNAINVGGNTTLGGLLNVTGNSELARFTMSSARNSNSGYLTFYDPTGRSAYMGFGGANASFYINNDIGDIYVNPSATQTSRFQATVGLTLYASSPQLRLSSNTYGTSYNTVLASRNDATGILQLGNNGNNYIVAGTSVAGGRLVFAVNNTADFPTAPNGRQILELDNNYVSTRIGFRSTGWYGTPSSSATGLGIEIGNAGGSASYVYAYNRDNGSYGPLELGATTFALRLLGTTSVLYIDSTGAATFNNGVTVGGTGDKQVSFGADVNNGGIEIGKAGSSAATTPFIDFHSSANSGDYDVRLLVTGGSSSSSGLGSLNIYAYGGVSIAGPLSSSGYNITAGGGATIISGTGGFQNATFVGNARNRIWSFGNSDGYGLSYFQGSSGTGGSDSIGFHFGTPTAAGSLFTIDASGGGRLTTRFSNGSYDSAGSYSTLQFANQHPQSQTSIDFTTQNTIKGRIRNDYVGNMTYVAYSGGVHAFNVGGDVSVGNVYLQVDNAGMLIQNGNLRFANTGQQLVGVYDPSLTRGLYAMGASYVLPPISNGTYGNFYGLAYSYEPNNGSSGTNPQSKVGLEHQLLLMSAGVTKTAIGTGIWTAGTFYAGNTATFANGINVSGNINTSTLNGSSIDANPTNSIPVRIGDGYLYAKYFNQASTDEGANITSVSTFQGDNFLRKTNINTFADQLMNRTLTISAAKYFVSNYDTANGVSPALMAYSTNGSGAVMAFHRSGAYAVNMGLDSDNVFRIGGWSASANRLQMDMSGNLTMAGNITAYSDVRLKTNIRTITNALTLVGQMRGVRFRKDDREQVGVIAQEVQLILPEVVSQSNDAMGTLGVAHGNIVGVLIEAIKELNQRVKDLEEQRNS